jgi:hypothetical protein
MKVRDLIRLIEANGRREQGKTVSPPTTSAVFVEVG